MSATKTVKTVQVGKRASFVRNGVTFTGKVVDLGWNRGEEEQKLWPELIRQQVAILKCKEGETAVFLKDLTAC